MTTTLKSFRKEVMETEAITRAHGQWRKESPQADGLKLYAAMLMIRASIQLSDLNSETQPERSKLHDCLNRALRGFVLAAGDKAEWPKLDMPGSLACASVHRLQKHASDYLWIIQDQLFGGPAANGLIGTGVLYNFGYAFLDFLLAWDLTLEWVMKPYDAAAEPEQPPTQIPNGKMKHLTEMGGTPKNILVAPISKIVGAEELREYCYRWLDELGLPVTDETHEIVIRFAPAFAGKNKGLEYLRSLLLGGIADGHMVTCQTAKGAIVETSLGDPSVLAIIRSGGRARWNNIDLQPREAAVPALN